MGTAWGQAVSEGKWLVIEDLNLAPMDVLAALVPLLERRQLQLPQREQSITAAEGFQLLATITSSPGDALQITEQVSACQFGNVRIRKQFLCRVTYQHSWLLSQF